MAHGIASQRRDHAVKRDHVTERSSLMQIRLMNTDQFYPATRCATCGERFTPEAVLALIYSQAGIALGTICEECVQAERNELLQRAHGYAARLRRHAETLEHAAEEGLDVFPAENLI
jgi:hypothetical protein